MICSAMLRSLFLAVLMIFIVSGQKALPQPKGSPEMMDPALVYGSDGEVISRVQSQLLGALQMLQAYQDGPTKLAEKRRNKFEFIRFGRK
ncbi:hypothetical protein QR680_001820 [Steinernema hermaphroditum]|uniref:Uncharacterized protein n=1 Tax=Steinernema hermaphroditum TaxID=289476 RepID=A0AA39H018_9BILA|nr:hypothetical protein QR680_001820 [Steinernema hermaphroditum]